MKSLKVLLIVVLALVACVAGSVFFDGCSQKAANPVFSTNQDNSSNQTVADNLPRLTLRPGVNIPDAYFTAQESLGNASLDSAMIAHVDLRSVDPTATSLGSTLNIWFPFGPSQVDLWTGETGTRTNGGMLDICGGYISTHSGADYYARDMSRNDGQPSAGQLVYAGYSGWVVRAGWDGGYGNVVVIWDPNRSVCTRYAHLQSVIVAKGQYISIHTRIGYVGNTPGGFSPTLSS